MDRGLTQTQVAGEYMTRNMLSQLENDAAFPSVKTLQYLSDTLGVSIGWLLNEDNVEDFSQLEKVRELYRAGKSLDCLRILTERDAAPNEEESLLLVRCALHCADQALLEKRYRDADAFLRAAERCKGLYIGKQERLQIASVRLRWKLEQGDTDDALLQSVLELWNPEETAVLTARHDLLNGRKRVASANYDEALSYLHRAEAVKALPLNERYQLYQLLELCYKEKEDYKQAYHYASLRMVGK